MVLPASTSDTHTEERFNRLNETFISLHTVARGRG